MTIDPGKFQLYSMIDPVLAAGEYRFTAEQTLQGGGGSSPSMPVDDHDSHVRVRSPRYLLPPDQVLSVFPPAGTEGAYGSRLPQVVIKRRTLPWERDLEDQPSVTPWLALVVVAEGEAELQLNQPVADCVTPGVELEGVADVELGNTLSIRQSVMQSIFPTQKDVPLLAHAREVDINDTELMMGDDDGFLSVVIANRLPLTGVDESGASKPVKYLACLVNLEGQFPRLREKSEERKLITTKPLVMDKVLLNEAEYDLRRMEVDPVRIVATGAGLPIDPGLLVEREGLALGDAGGLTDEGAAGDAAAGARISHAEMGAVEHTVVATSGAVPFSGDATWTLDDAETVASNIYAEMAGAFTTVYPGALKPFDPIVKFPVLLHWSFTSFGDQTFEELMRGLDSGLIGTVDADRAAPVGRDPLEVVETGHVGLAHRSRHGDSVRSWFRGPLMPHPADETAERLPLAHVADQLRTVIPDGREDLSLASAFEIGRLLALSHPSMVAAMLQWRRTNFLVQRKVATWSLHPDFVGGLLGDLGVDPRDPRFGVEIGRGFIRQLTAEPGGVIGPPRQLIDPGRPIDFERPTTETVAAGFGLDADVFDGDPAAMLGALRRIELLPADELGLDLRGPVMKAQLHQMVDAQIIDLVSGTLGLRIDVSDAIDPRVLGPTIPGTILPDFDPAPVVDRLGLLLNGPAGADDGPSADGPANRSPDGDTEGGSS